MKTYSYLVFEYPVNAAFTPTAAPVININPFLSGTTNSVIAVSKTGVYDYGVTNTLTGCQALGHFTVLPGDLTANFDADYYQGFAPLTVNFTNISASSLNSFSISSVWSLGNGATATTSFVTVPVQTTYNAPGTYTVMLLTSKGNCLDTVWKTIRVDIPSKLEVPNIFTPNGDGSNDVFFLKTANITEVTAYMFDRWGNKVYETNSKTGNIAWDGNNFQGKECPAGIYFYIIKGMGSDNVKYDTKGNNTLVK